MAKLSLVQLKGNTFYVPSPANVGIFVDGVNATLIDSGSDKEAGRQLLRIINENGWNLKLIINTHSNADHIGGNAFLQEKTGCKIVATGIEASLISHPILEPTVLYGGFPSKDLRNKFLMAKVSKVSSIPSTGQILDTGLEAVPLPGHFMDMIGVRTPDNVLFIADTLFPENIIEKYHLFVLWDIKAHLETLEMLQGMEADVFVPSHGNPVTDLEPLININTEKILEIRAQILGFCSSPATMEEIMQHICKKYDVALNPTQYVLLSSTIRAYLTYLYEEGWLECFFEDGRMLWKSVPEEIK